MTKGYIRGYRRGAQTPTPTSCKKRAFGAVPGDFSREGRRLFGPSKVSDDYPNIT